MSSGRENLIPFDKRSEEEVRELARKGGKASGRARERKANFRKTLNLLLTAKIDSPEWTPVLEALGLDSTLESAVNGAMIKEALSGNVKAYEAIAKYAGQADQTDEELKHRKADTELKQARKEAMTGENEEDEALNKLDQILKEVHDDAVKQQTK